MKTGCVFIGEVDLVGQVGDYKIGYEKNGYKTYTIIKNPKNATYQDIKFDVVISGLYFGGLRDPSKWIYKRIRNIYKLLVVTPLYYLSWMKALFICDIFHLVWIYDKKWKRRLWILKKLNKKVIVSFCGSDVKWFPVYMQQFSELGLEHTNENLLMESTIKNNITLNSPLRVVRIAEKYADVILSVPEQAQLALRPYHHFYLPVRQDRIVTKFGIKGEKPTVAIGVGYRKGKDSDTVINLVTELKSIRNDFDLVIIESMSHEEVLRILSETDIFVYTPFINGAGKFGFEALLSGAVVLTGYNENLLKLPADSPVVDINSKNLQEKLSYYIDNFEERIVLAKKSVLWAQKYSDQEWICKNIIENLKYSNHVDHVPKFFRYNASFNTKWDDADSFEVVNKWNRYVMGCKWYSQYVESGERDRMVF